MSRFQSNQSSKRLVLSCDLSACPLDKQISYVAYPGPLLACQSYRWINLGFQEIAHLPLPQANINTCFSLRAKCWLRGGVSGQFPRILFLLEDDLCGPLSIAQVSFKNYLPSKIISLSLTTRQDFLQTMLIYQAIFTLFICVHMFSNWAKFKCK